MFGELITFSVESYMNSYESHMKNIYCVQNSEFFNVSADGAYNYVL